VAAREDQSEPVVDERHLLVPSSDLDVVDDAGLERERCGLLLQRPLSPKPIDRPVARGGRDPGAGVGGDTAARPRLERPDERLLDGLLGEVEVTQDADERRDRPSRFLTEQAVDKCVGLG
jgi:hypothetical protein